MTPLMAARKAPVRLKDTIMVSPTLDVYDDAILSLSVCFKCVCDRSLLDSSKLIFVFNINFQKCHFVSVLGFVNRKKCEEQKNNETILLQVVVARSFFFLPSTAGSSVDPKRRRSVVMSGKVRK